MNEDCDEEDEADQSATAIVADPSTTLPAPISVEAPPVDSLGASQASESSPLDVDPTYGLRSHDGCMH